MLKILEIAEKLDEKVEVDLYVPFKIKIGLWNESKEHTVYWRTGDSRKSLFEVGIGKDSGKIRSLTLVQAKPVVQGLQKCVDEKMIPSKIGIPICDVSEFPANGFIDEANDFQVCLSDDSILILFSKESHPISKIVCNRAIFGVDENNNMLSFQIVRLTENEVNTLKSALE